MSAQKLLQVRGAGSNGVDEMQPLLDDAEVAWALVRFNVGQGTLQRQKVLFLHINGEDCPPLVRGRANGLTNEVQSVLRGGEGKDGFHAALEVKRAEEVTLKKIMKKVGKVFITDSGDYDVQAYIKDMENQAAKAAARQSVAPVDVGDPTAVPYKFSQLFSKGRDALKAVAEPLGPWNWVFFEPDPDNLPIVAGGNGSVDEMRECLALHQAQVMFGVLRLGFGEGRLRRTKHVFVHTLGQEAPAVTRAKHTTLRPKVEGVVRSFVLCSVTFGVALPEDLSLEEIIDRVRRAAIVDDDVLDRDNPEKSQFSVEAFRKALREEQEASESVETVEQQRPGCNLSVEKALQLIHAPGGVLNWALFVPDEEWLYRRTGGKRKLPATPRGEEARGESTDAAPPKTSMTTNGSRPLRQQLLEPVAAEPARRDASQPPPVRFADRTARPLGGEAEDEEQQHEADREAEAEPPPAPAGRERAESAWRQAGGAALRSGSAPVRARSRTESQFAVEPEAEAETGTTVAAVDAKGGPSEELPKEEEPVDKSTVDDEESKAKSGPTAQAQSAPEVAIAMQDWDLGFPILPQKEEVKEDKAEKAAVEEDPKAVLGAGARDSQASHTSLQSFIGAPAEEPVKGPSLRNPEKGRPRCAGALLKLSRRFFGGWQLRWFQVSNGTLQWWDRPEEAEAGEEPKGTLQLHALKVSMQRNSNSVFILHAENTKGKEYLLDANVATQLTKAGWSAAVVAQAVCLSAADWVRALEQEAILHRRVT